MGRIPTIFYCAYENCSASFNRKHRLEAHTRSHTGERPFKCCYENCDKSYITSSHLKRHEQSHASPFKCPEKNCFEVFKNKYYLKKHLKIVHLKIKKHKTYTCTQCNRDFNKHNTLQRHLLRHTGEQPFKCSVEDCKKQFNTPSRLKRHMKIHEGYPCKVPNCDKKFQKWSLYVQHTRNDHLIENKCNLCQKVFSTSYRLKLHSRSHEELRTVYPCQVQNCSRYYYAKKNLDWHMRHYHEKRPFTCEVQNCHRAFKTEAELNDHMIWGRRGHGKGWKRLKKNKTKQHKPSFAALLSGCADIKRVNRKPASESKSMEIEEESDTSIFPDKCDTRTLESATTLTVPEVNSFESSQPTGAGDVIVPAGYNTNSTVCVTNDSVTEDRTLESNAFTFATIEVIGGENSSSQVIAVPVINAVNDKYWKESGAFLIQQVS